MLLLYRACESSSSCACIIYIPLCFYFIESQLTEQLSTFCNLHSTMLLLYRWRRPHNPAFSFIYIPLCFYFIQNLIIMETSSEPIYIPLCFYFIGCLSFSLVKLYHIYIPLCFYFISYRAFASSACASFTFHYASTLSSTSPLPARCN